MQTCQFKFISNLSLAAKGSSITFAEKQCTFNERLKQHHFGDAERDSFTRIFVSRQDLLQSVSFLLQCLFSFKHGCKYNTVQAMEETKSFKNEDWLKQFVVNFRGEEGRQHLSE